MRPVHSPQTEVEMTMLMTLLALFAPITLVGVLSEDGIEACQDGEQRWVNVHPTVGWSGAYGMPMRTDLKGKLVQVTAEVIPPPKSGPVQNDFTCPPMQARNDWIRAKDGIRYKRDLTAPRYDLKIKHIKPFTGLKARFDVMTDTVTVTVDNPLPQAMVDVSLVLHYEGCYGKPGTMKLTRPLGRIEPGKQVVVETLPARRLRETTKGNEHALAYIQVVTPAAPVIDIDVKPAAVGALITCGDRKGRKR